MENILLIAKKELYHLFSSKLVILILIWYLLTFIISFYSIVNTPDGAESIISHFENPIDLIFVNFTYSLCYYGTLVGIILGFVSMSIETDGKALNTLLTKPVYRDTIINGKLLGLFIFFICLFMFTISLYIFAMVVFYGVLLNSSSLLINSYIPLFIERVPLSFVLSFFCITFFFSLSMLFSIISKEQSLSLFLSLFVWVMLFDVLNDFAFAGYLGYFFHSDSLTYDISCLSIYSMLYFILGYTDIHNVIVHNGFELFKLFIYCFITIIFTYIVFLRRNVE